MADAQTRELVRRRAGERCEYCLLPEHAEPYFSFHLDHIVARQHGGDDGEANLCWSCSRCNRRKGTNLASIDDETGEQVALLHPRLQAWHDHFTMHSARIAGTTPTGRVTVRLLDMNVRHRVRLRAELIKQGQFHIG